MAEARATGPRISPLWLAGLLSGDVQCQWASWFRTHHEDWDRVETPGLPGLDWQTQYTVQLNGCIRRYEEQGYTVSNGAPNAYSLSLGDAVLSGRPDVIATKGDDCIVIDFPKGEANRSHELQAITHLYALPRAVERLRGMSPRGELVYSREMVDIPADSVDREFIEKLYRQAERLASKEPLARVPSPDECWTCDITASDCFERMEDDGTRPFRMPDVPGGEAFFAMLERAEWAEADRDRAHQGRMRAEARIKELEEARRPPGL
jgi:hypothetical protein